MTTEKINKVLTVKIILEFTDRNDAIVLTYSRTDPEFLSLYGNTPTDCDFLEWGASKIEQRKTSLRYLEPSVQPTRQIEISRSFNDLKL